MSKYFPLSNDLSKHTIFPGVEIATCAANQMMMSLVKMVPNSEVKPHSHLHEQVGMVLKGSAIFVIGNESKELKEGDFYRIPSNTLHQVRSMQDGLEALDIFNPIRKDYL